MVYITAILGLYVLVLLAVMYVGRLAVIAWQNIELRRIESIKQDEIDKIKQEVNASLGEKLKDLEDLKVKMNKLQLEKVMKNAR